jgi:hypothetical protein
MFLRSCLIIGTFGLAVSACSQNASLPIPQEDPQPSLDNSPEANSLGPEMVSHPGDATASPTSKLRLGAAHAALDALCIDILDALKENSFERLDEMRVTEEEYTNHMFPELPESSPDRTIPVEFLWKMMDTKFRKGIRTALRDYGGRDFEFLEAIVTQGVKEYPTFKIHRKVKLRVASKETERVNVITVFSSVVEMDGVFKIIGFPS